MKSIIITGASSGIGRAAAELFLENGWQVGLIARRAELLEDIANTYETATALPADVTDPVAMKEAFDGFVAQTGRLDALFNNAGMFGPMVPIDEVPLDQWMQVLNVNVGGMFIAAQLAFAQMRNKDPQGGRIINNGSLSAHVPRPNSVCYTTTKHAISGLTKTISLDGRACNVACGHRQRRDGYGRSTQVDPTPDIDDGCATRSGCGAPHGQSTVKCKCADHDGHGDANALCRARLSH